MTSHSKKMNGFTILEALVSLSIAATFIGSMLSIWVYSSRNFKEESTRTETRFGLEKALERMKQDVRLTDGNKILFYPSSGAPYTAVSLPSASVDGSGFYTYSSSITWNRTIIYHIYDNSGVQELRRSVFSTYNSTASARQTQLDAVVTSGGDASATTTTLFKGTAISLDIVPSSPTFDGYNSTLSLSTLTTFGSSLLAPGNHNLRFTVAGKNTASSGYKMGFDQFVAAPSGDSGQEAEVLTVSATSGGSMVSEDMSSYASSGSWKGNYQVEQQSSGVGSYTQFQIYNDQWIESNFENMTHSYTETLGTDPELKVASRETQSLSPAWKAESQSAATDADNSSSICDRTYRNIISSSSITRGGTLVRFKFRASSTGNLKINAAYFGARSAGTYNFSGAPTQLYFNNGTVSESGTDATGAVGTAGPTAIDIPLGEHAWTNWVAVAIPTPATSDYLISFSVDSTAGKGNETYWDPTAAGATQSYYETGATANATWLPADAGLSSDDAIHAVEEMSAWDHVGVAVSQIYDTKMTSPVYGQILWSTNASGTYSLKVRSSSNSQMTGATAWSAASAYTSSPGTISASSARYVQFQATLTTASPYTTYPSLDDVIIRWPGQTTLVEFSGIYTKRPNYGTFGVLLDGSALYNALDVSLTGTKTYQGRDYEATMSASVRAKNTGK